jgi:sugar phosphate isomerase/epimerase
MATPLHLCGFADEIGPELDDQIAVCNETGVTHFELRSVGGTNVLGFGSDERDEIKRKLDAAGLGVASIGSPCGKQPIDKPEAELLDQFRVALDMAVHFEAPLIRVFSFYPPGGEGKGPIEPVGERAIDLLRKQADILDHSGTDVVMVHENEKGIFGDTGDRCRRLIDGVASPRFRSAFDFANFVQCGENPADNWPKLRDSVSHIHIKDAVMGTGKVVPAGEGDGGIGPILQDAHGAGYGGFLSLEPHLKVAGHSHGETGPELWRTAVSALRSVCDSHGIPLAS